MATVKAKPGESFESLMKRFKKVVDRAGILSDLKKKEYYEKPSVKRKRKQEAARKRAIKKLKKMRGSRWKTGGPSFRFNKDKTEKIPMVNRSKDSKPSSRPHQKRSSFNAPRQKGK